MVRSASTLGPNEPVYAHFSLNLVHAGGRSNYERMNNTEKAPDVSRSYSRCLSPQDSPERCGRGATERIKWLYNKSLHKGWPPQIFN